MPNTEINRDLIRRAARSTHANLARSRPLLTQAFSDLTSLSGSDLAGVLSTPDEPIELVVTLRASSHDGAHITSVLRGVHGGKALTVTEQTL